MIRLLNQRRWPLFVRIFGLMLLTVLLVQILNFALVVAMPLPTPNVHRIGQIVTALRTGVDPSGLLRVSDRDSAPQLSADPGDARFAHRLAADLAVAADRVRGMRMGGLPLGIGDAVFRPRPPGARGLRPPPDRQEGGGDDLVFGRFTVSLKLPDGRWRSVAPVSTGVDPWRWRILLWLVVAVLVVAPFAWMLARRLARPIRLFAFAAERLGRDPRAAPLALSGPPEVMEAAAAFNEMQARLNSYVQDRTTLLAAIAHDLRTPLMRLTMRLEHAPVDVRDSAEADIQEMDQRITAVMGFVRDMNRPARRQKLDLRSLAQSVTDDFADLGKPVTLHPGDPIVTTGDAPALKALLANLIGNAVKYGGRATVRCAVAADQIVIEVIDQGAGMRAEDVPFAFEPFFRGEKSRGRDTGGIGLGLASVRAGARAHGGEAFLENRVTGGMIARVVLPA
ncbi:ATP-binding protein [soil metagenome]